MLAGAYCWTELQDLQEHKYYWQRTAIETHSAEQILFLHQGLLINPFCGLVSIIGVAICITLEVIR